MTPLSDARQLFKTEAAYDAASRICQEYESRIRYPRARQFVQIMTAPDREADATFVEMIHLMLNHFRYQREPKKLSNEELRCLEAPTQILMGEYEAAFHPATGKGESPRRRIDASRIRPEGPVRRPHARYTAGVSSDSPVVRGARFEILNL